MGIYLGLSSNRTMSKGNMEFGVSKGEPGGGGGQMVPGVERKP